ncbi:poly [ADP-ribose] polymerase 1-like [Ostrinia furnacalis]|uniref:poly [ADP-ribose] polymerase 1-like n=1 Tax=Ostrinia furnacalis TaxID=93504 RepID=UPI00103F82A1|nr:poly [ADP-ribose] polymerase 1-like [Ostrinia furnacalis]
MELLPYKADYAKSGRASCKYCGLKIPEGSLRIGRQEKMPGADKFWTKWYHVSCIFKDNIFGDYHPPTTNAEISNFMQLNVQDQEYINCIIEAGSMKTEIPHP